MQSIRDIYDTAEWVDVSAAGSSFEVQLNQRTGHFRHRPRHFGVNANVQEEWSFGQPKKTSNG